MRHWRTTENSNVAIQTGSTYISDSMTNITTISTVNLGFSTTPSAMKLMPGDCDNDRQPEMANIDVLLANHAISGSRSLSQSFGLSSWTSKVPNLALEFRRYLSEFYRCNYVRFWRPYRYFRLSVVVVFTCRNYFSPIRGLIPQICRWNLTVLFTVLEIQVFPVSAAVSDCQSSLKSPRYSSCEFAVVKRRRFDVGMLMVYVTVSDISVLPVSWLPSWIFDTR